MATKKPTGVRLYSGHDTFGAAVEVAIGRDGRCFARHYSWNGYGYGWSRWAPHAPTHPTEVYPVTEPNDGLPITLTQEQSERRVLWGFRTLHMVTDSANVRLPKL
jgi:hypothetical protein